MSWCRPHLQRLVPYGAARHEFQGAAITLLDANESPFDTEFNRYPDPMQRELKALLAQQKGLVPEQIFIGNGSDEAIDLLVRAACEPEKDSIAICSPTYGMYQVVAATNNVPLIDVPLRTNFQLNTEVLLEKATDAALIFICSPNNPTGNLIDTEDIELLLKQVKGLVVVDEAYIDFASAPSWTQVLKEYPNLVVLQTFSKALGLAGLRIGAAYAQPSIIEVLNAIKPPYNVNTYSQQEALTKLRALEIHQKEIEQLIVERESLANALQEFQCIEKVFPSNANFLLCRSTDATDLYRYLLARGVVVRNRSQALPNTLRITVGSPQQNECLLTKISHYEKDTFY